MAEKNDPQKNTLLNAIEVTEKPGPGEDQAGKDGEIVDKTLLCGWGKWRPKFLQPLSRPTVFLTCLALYSLTAGIVSGLTPVNLPDIEKEFGLSSKQSAVILLANDVAGMIMLPAISFYGTHGKKPKWIGIGAIVIGLGALLMTIPKLMIGEYILPGFSKMPNVCTKGQLPNFASCSDSKEYASSSKYLAVFCLAQFIIGIGFTPLWPLGPAYLDENVNPKMAPIYVGVWFVCSFLGRGLGYVVGGSFSRFFTNLYLPEGVSLSRNDPRWIGAWWLGFFVFSWVAIIAGGILLCFPKEMPKYRKKRLEAIKDGKLPSANEDIGKGFVDFLKALVDLLKNKTYVFSSLGLTVKIIFAAALGGFYTKILVLKFGGTLSTVSLLSAAVFIPGNAIGVGIGSFVMKKMSIANSAKRASLYLVITGVVLSIFSTVWIIPGCKSTNIAGATVPYKDSLGMDSLKSRCNIHCTCSRQAFEPICGTDGLTYFSPCFAGCQSNSRTGASNCSCIFQDTQTKQTNKTKRISRHNGSNATEVEGFFGNALTGRCNRQCKNIFIFLALSAFNLMVSFSGSIPQKMLTLRCVADNQRTFGLGIQLLFLRSLSFIPGPLILGSIIDSNCLLWRKDECGNKGNCLEYNVDQLSKHFFTFALAAGVSATIFYFLAWYFFIPLQGQIEEKQQDKNDNSTLLKDSETNK